MRATPAVLLRTSIHEFTMQARRPALWLVMILVIGLPYLAIEPLHPLRMPPMLAGRALMGYWAMEFNLLCPIAFAILMSGRLPRDRQLRVRELLAATPTRFTTRLWAMYLGGTLATGLPIVAGMVAAATYEAFARRDPMIVPDGALALVAVNLPGLLAIGAVSILVPAVTWPPLYWILFVAYWVWGNLLNPTVLPTLSGTLLTPIGNNAASGILGTSNHFFTGTYYQPPFLSASLLSGMTSIGLLLAIAAATILLGGLAVAWMADAT